MKPSDFKLGYPPFVGTLGRYEMETAMALLIYTCKVKGDVLQPVRPIDISTALKMEPIPKEIGCILTFPFGSGPDFHSLLERGFISGSLKPMQPVEVTMWGLVSLHRYWWPENHTACNIHKQRVEKGTTCILCELQRPKEKS